MKAGEFIVNGISSLEFGAFIQSRPIINAPKRKKEYVEMFGRSGRLINDENSYENSSMELLGYCEAKDGASASKNRERLFNMFNNADYLEMVFHFDPGKVYRVDMEEPLSFEARYYYGEGQAWTMTLSIHPYKYFTNSNDAIILSDAGTIVNPHLIESEPLIRVTGTGQITLKINDVEYPLNNVTEYIILDSNTGYGYKELAGGILQNENKKVLFREFPVLAPGENDISWVGNVSSLEIIPRWRSLI